MGNTDDALALRLSAALGSSYRLGPLIGRGGMGAVYRATDERLRREVAIKVLPPEFAYRDDLRRRFVREAQLAAGLSHPNIVSVFDVGDHDDLVWFVMGWVDGESVRTKVERDGPLTQRQATRVLREVAWALAYAHAHGIVHRDVKPDNILLERGTGRALVTDFGIAKALQTETTGVTASGMVVGSLMYMAPEQALAEKAVDGRADLYALGLVGYYMLSGRPPFESVTVMSVARRYATRATPDFAAISHRPNPALRGALERCLAPMAEERWPDAEKFLDALGPIGEPPRAIPAPIRRLMRDFLLFPVVGLVVLAAWAGLEMFTALELTVWIVVVLAVNGVVTLRAYARRGYGWPELRDTIDRELLVQDEEMQATAILNDRLKVLVYFGTFAWFLTKWADSIVLVHLRGRGVSAIWAVVLLVLLLGFASLSARIFTWLYQEMLRYLTKVLPPLPRPESPSRFARFMDRTLTMLFATRRLPRFLENTLGFVTRPLGPTFRLRSAEATPAPGPSATWDMTDLEVARRSTAAIREAWSKVPKADRKALRDAEVAGLHLSQRIADLRQARMSIQSEAERSLEDLDVLSKEAGAALEQVRVVLAAYASGAGDAEAAERAVRAASRVATSFAPWLDLAQRSGANKPWHALPSPPDHRPKPGHIYQLAHEIWTEWRRRPDLGTRWPDGGVMVNRVTDQLARLEEAATAQGLLPTGTLPPAVEESITQCEIVLTRLRDAARRQGAGTDHEIGEMLERVQELAHGVDALLEVYAPPALDGSTGESQQEDAR